MERSFDLKTISLYKVKPGFLNIIFSIMFIINFISISNPVFAKNEISSETVLKILFGRYDSNRKVFAHELTNAEKKRFEITNADGKIFYTGIAFIKPYQQNGINKYFIITETKNNMFDCHPCAPITGLAVLVKNNNVWKIEEKHQYVERIGGWGKTAEPSVINLGKNNYGLFFEDGYTGMGIVSSWVFIIGKVNNAFKTILKEEDYSQTNEGDCGKGALHKCFDYNSKIDFDKNAKAEFYPITLTTSGTKFNNSETPQSFKRIKKYIFSKGKYQLNLSK